MSPINHIGILTRSIEQGHAGEVTVLFPEGSRMFLARTETQEVTLPQGTPVRVLQLDSGGLATVVELSHNQ